MFDFSSPFFRPLWRRLLILGICFGWAAFEASSGAAIWAVIFASLGALAGYNFFITRPFD